jgi:hypothetical protein
MKEFLMLNDDLLFSQQLSIENLVSADNHHQQLDTNDVLQDVMMMMINYINVLLEISSEK